MKRCFRYWRKGSFFLSCETLAVPLGIWALQPATMSQRALSQSAQGFVIKFYPTLSDTDSSAFGIGFDLTCQLGVHKCQRSPPPPFQTAYGICCSIQVAYSNNANPTSVLTQGNIWRSTFIRLNSPGNQVVSQIITFVLEVVLHHRTLWSPQPTNRPQGLPAVFSGRPAPPPTAIHHQVCKRGEQKVLLHVRFLFPPCSSSLSPLLILTWKCPIAFI